MRNTKECLVIFEKSMNQRYVKLAEYNHWNYFTMDLNNSFELGFLVTILHRIQNRRILNEKIDELVDYIRENGFETIYLSNLEGYISLNSIISLKKAFPKIKFIALQHGVFLAKKRRFQTVINFFNSLIRLFTRVYVLGVGFGGYFVDQYVVYGQYEKAYLLKNGWKENQIQINLNFLKAYLLDPHKSKQSVDQNRNLNAIFLLQSLSGAKLCSVEQENVLIEKTLIYLTNKYECVYVKEHPYCYNRELILPKNAFMIDDLVEGFYKCNSAYSFFSTALIDAKVFELEIFAIKSETVSVDHEIYNLFDNVIIFENEINS